MIYLIGSVILSSWLTLSFKVVERLKIDSFQAIVFNYITCVITGSVVNGGFPLSSITKPEPWLGWGIFMGIVFISVFNVVAFTTQKVGIAAASVAYKLSLVIPFTFSILMYGEKFTALKLAGIIVAIVSVILTCWPGRRRTKIDKTGTGEATSNTSYTASMLMILMPVILFISSGLLDSMIKYVEQAFLNESNNNSYLIIAFASAALTGVLALVVLVLAGKTRIGWKAVLAGIGIGIPNYFSIWCLLRVLKDNYGNSSAIIPINNMGIVLFSALIAWLVFKERLTVINAIGIILAVLAIAFIAYG